MEGSLSIMARPRTGQGKVKFVLPRVFIKVVGIILVMIPYRD
jgi:hypothetical protein